ncbi:alanine racemase [Psychrosphaera saromensis]|uniref:Alanine racemase n=1 Tax=Psychrosphaera saromensis TaxID=716813 RepID=A0A2S7UTC6_9GAMM|nr:alanine racemase [Psychrosphaera saromensis]PQJ53197.1 alanine racemase [Psychrosphaera saromensis]GHB67236.1 alanine racemase [Psychrosphaera saromensis]GLQ15040.1 alanine racemase [Psychrosphaera saromensis]
MKIAVAEINLTALLHNIEVIRKLAPTSKILAMLKANAYGHGYLEIAEALTNVDAFGVARLEEATKLRTAGIQKSILLLEGFFDKTELLTIAEQQLETVLHTKQQVLDFINADLPRPVKVWLKLDTGMHRIGLPPSDFEFCYKALFQHKNVLGLMTLMTHMACADEQDNPLNQKQLSLFNKLAGDLPCEHSIANSATIMSIPAAHKDWIRPGIMMYGASAMSDSDAAEHDLKPVMTLKSSVIAVRDVKQGDSVGYGATWTASEDTQVAIVALGYGDGYPRNAENGTPVLINGTEYPLVGRVSMDMITINVGVNAQVNIGDEVILWGDGLAIERVARHAHSISYELLCGLTGRVKKQFSY